MRDIKDYAAKYVNEPFEDVIVEIRKRNIIEQCKKYTHRRILEVGCGINPFFMGFEDFEHMVIVEPSEDFVHNARMLVKEVGLSEKITIYNNFLEDTSKIIKVDEKEFDIIIVSSLLHEVEAPEKLLGSILDLCSDSTVVHINVPNAHSLHRLIALESGMISDVHEQSAQQILMQRHRTYDMPLLISEVVKGGFQIESKGSYFIKPFTHKQMQMCLDGDIIDENVIMGLEKVTKYIPEFGAEIYVNAKREGHKI